MGRPVTGTIVVMEREGGGHITFYEYTDDNGNYACRGGNQSDAVNVQHYDPDTIVALIWPKAAGAPPQIPIEDRPVLEEGDSGPDVVDLQRMIPRFTGETDGDFGPITEENVIRYQTSRGLEVDGVVGQETWGALYDDKPPLPPPELPPGALTREQQIVIKRIANESWIASYNWHDRGAAPEGYTQGMALAFAQTMKKLNAGHRAAAEMAKARTDSDKDALNEYAEEFRRLGMNNERDGIDTLRHLYALMLGSGMRESSGMYCEGRDQSAENYDSTTCEAGLFQTSYNAHGASDPDFDNLMDEYLRGLSPGYVEAFAEGVTCSASDWENYGSGRGEQFQDLCKNEPAFAVETHALTLRNLCNHYGPIIRHEVELKHESDKMFKAVQDYMEEAAVA
jgi:peptidoglycan hydrolase-like protein with peptidoglycan-binding domain